MKQITLPPNHPWNKPNSKPVQEQGGPLPADEKTLEALITERLNYFLNCYDLPSVCATIRNPTGYQRVLARTKELILNQGMKDIDGALVYIDNEINLPGQLASENKYSVFLNLPGNEKDELFTTDDPELARTKKAEWEAAHPGAQVIALGLDEKEKEKEDGGSMDEGWMDPEEWAEEVDVLNVAPDVQAPDEDTDTMIWSAMNNRYGITFEGLFLGYENSLLRALDRVNEEKMIQKMPFVKVWIVDDHGAYWQVDTEGNEMPHTRGMRQGGAIKSRGGELKSSDIVSLAAKHKVPVSEIEAQLAKGIEVEKEHTSDTAIARKIAMDHLAERADYYTMLEQIEKSGKMQMGGPSVNNMNTPSTFELTLKDDKLTVQFKNQRFFQLATGTISDIPISMVPDLMRLVEQLDQVAQGVLLKGWKWRNGSEGDYFVKFEGHFKGKFCPLRNSGSISFSLSAMPLLPKSDTLEKMTRGDIATLHQALQQISQQQ